MEECIKQEQKELLTPNYIYHSDSEYKGLFHNDNFIKSVNFLNKSEIVLLSNDDKFRLIKLKEEDNSSKSIHTQELFTFKETNHVYDYDMYDTILF